MKTASRLAASLTLIAGLAGCDSIGEGSTVETLRIIATPVDISEQGTYIAAGTADERYHMYDCFCSNIAVLATFTNGTVANFSNRATFSSDRPDIVTVLNYGQRDSAACPGQQQGAGLLIPKSIGTATITAQFASLRSTLRVEVADTSFNADGSPVTYVMEAAPPAISNDVPVGAAVSLRVSGTLDGRERFLNRNVVGWSFDNPDDTLAKIDSIGIVRGFGRTGDAPRIARASFGTCTDVSPTLAVNVGDIVSNQILVEREASDFTDDPDSDEQLAVDSDENPQVTARLDFHGNGVTAEGSQLISAAARITFTDTCTLREYDATVPTTFCRETAGATCADTVAECSAASDTACTPGMAACRTAPAPLTRLGNNRIVAVADSTTPTLLTATFPANVGAATTLASDVPDASSTTITVAALTGYPTSFPWFATIDQGGANREDVRVDAATGTTLTVVRGITGTTAGPHASGASFGQRVYTSDPAVPLKIRAKKGTLTTVAINPPSGALAPLGSLQLVAQGTFVDDASLARQQHVTHLTTFAAGSPEVSWLGSDGKVAVVGSTGLVFSTSACGGRVSVRARSSTSTDATTASFDAVTTADDDACKNTDPLCDQIELCVATQSPLPLGTTCDTVTTCP